MFRLFTQDSKAYLGALEGMEKYLETEKLPEEQETLSFLQDLAKLRGVHKTRPRPRPDL